MSEAVSHKEFRLRVLLDAYQVELSQDTGSSFLAGVRAIVDAVADSHSGWLDALNNASVPSVRDATVDHVRTHSVGALRILSNIHEHYLPLLHAAANQSSYLFRPILNRAIDLATPGRKIRSELVLVPRFEYTYGFTGLLRFATREVCKLPYSIQSQKKAKIRACRALPKVTAFVSYPAADKESALKLTAIAHEMAHLIDYIGRIHQHILKLVPLQFDSESFDALLERKKGSAQGPSDEQIEADCYERCRKLLTAWLHEIIADVIATRALGPAYFLAFRDFLTDAGADGSQADEEHPAPAKRLEVMIGELSDLEYLDVDHGLRNELRKIKGTIASEAVRTEYEGEFRVVDRTLEQQRGRILSALRDYTRQYSYPVSRYASEVPGVLKKLEAGVSPIENDSGGANSAIAILNAAWQIYAIQFDEFRDKFADNLSREEVIDNLNRLVFKALEGGEILRKWGELAPADSEATAEPRNTTETTIPPILGATLTRKSLLENLDSGKLVVTPILDRAQVGEGSIDIRLGTQFIVNKRPELSEIDPHTLTPENIQKFQELVVVPFEDRFMLHPGSFLLGCTMEFIALPADMCGFVLSRSGYGRAGLLIATATYVHPGWHGCLTLELENLGEVPIALWPGSRVGQLVLLRADEILLPKLKAIPVGPRFSSLSEDPRWDKIRKTRLTKGDRASRGTEQSRR
jgi:deoxycytidine triphosphate deaminase